MRAYNGIHFYINLNNLNKIIKDDEKSHDDLCRTFHALNTFTATMEKFANEFGDVEVEKFTTSRLHFYIPIDNNDNTVTTEMLELVAFSKVLTNFINKNSKYQSLIDFKIGAGADYGKYTEFKFTDAESQLEEMTTIGAPANRAAKLQSLCADGKFLISKEVLNRLPIPMRSLFFGNGEATKELARKYTDLTAYEADVDSIHSRLSDSYISREQRSLEYASSVVQSLNLAEMNISDTNKQLEFNNLSIKNSKSIESATILFSDIRGFTQRVDESNLSEMKQLTKIVLEMMNKAVRRRDGVHVQFQGDRESAVFNQYNSESDDYVLRAVLCAMQMLDKLDELNNGRDDKLNIGIGCAVGNTFATRIGMRGNKFNVVMGETVKEADDAEDNVAGTHIYSPQTEIAITEEMYKYLTNLPGKDSEFIKESFKERIYKGKKYYISTTRFSEYQKKAVVYSQEQNASRASNNGGLKPWGDC